MSAESPILYVPVSDEKHPFVIGATGGIGPHYVARIAQTSKVYAGYRKPQDRERLAAIHPNVIPVIADVTKAEDLRAVFDKGVSDVFNVGASVQLNDWDEARRVNVGGMWTLIKEANGRVRHVHQVSTRGVYGNQSKFPVKEDADHEGGGPYPVTKSQAERLLTENQDDLDFTISVVRPADVIGKDLDIWTHLFLNVAHGVELSEDLRYTDKKIPKIMKGMLNRVGFKNIPVPPTLAMLSLFGSKAVFAPVEVENLVDISMLIVGNKEAEGQAFNAVDFHSTFGDMINAYAEGVFDRRTWKIPQAVVDFVDGNLAKGLDFLGRKLDRPMLTEIGKYISDSEYELSQEKVRRVLGYESRVSFEESVLQTREYYEVNGLIKTRGLYK